MSKSNRVGSEPRHIRLYHWLTDSPAWRSLDVYERQLYVEFKIRYNGSNNGGIAFSGEEMALALNCSNRPADRALQTLIDRGFIKLVKKGYFRRMGHRKGDSKASEYLLAEHPIDLPTRSAMPPTKEFMKWRPSMSSTPSENARGALVTRVGCSRHPTKSSVGRPGHPSGVLSSPENDQNAHDARVLSSPAYNIPHQVRENEPPVSRKGRAAA